MAVLDIVSTSKYRRRSTGTGSLWFVFVALLVLTKPQLLDQLRNADNDDELIDALYGLGRRSRGDVADIAHLLDHADPEVRYALALALHRYRGSEARRLLARLAADPDPEVRDATTTRP